MYVLIKLKKIENCLYANDQIITDKFEEELKLKTGWKNVDIKNKINHESILD